MWSQFLSIASRTLPRTWSQSAKNAFRGCRRRLRPVPWDNLQRLTPIARGFGYHRGMPIDRYHIAQFLEANRSDISGRVLEIGEPTYTLRYGGGSVTRSEVLHAVDGNPEATIVGDLTTGEGIPRDSYDCLILTQTLSFLWDVRGAIQNAFSALKPGGVLLATCGGISQISRYDMERWGDYTRFTSLSLQRLFEEVFPPEKVTVEAYGNVLAAVALLHGIVAEDLTAEELDHRDPDYEVTVSVRAVRPR